jgi:hypothetical protein
VPQHALVEALEPDDADSARRKEVPSSVDGDSDLVLRHIPYAVRHQRRLTGQGCRPRVEDGSHPQLLLVRWAGVIDVHPHVERFPDVATDHPFDEVVRTARLEHLASRNDAPLIAHDGLEVHG